MRGFGLLRRLLQRGIVLPEGVSGVSADDWSALLTVCRTNSRPIPRVPPMIKIEFGEDILLEKIDRYWDLGLNVLGLMKIIWERKEEG